MERSGKPSQPSRESALNEVPVVDDVPSGRQEAKNRGSGKPTVQKPRSASVRRSEDIESYLRRLQASPDVAGKAFRELWSVPRSLIPQLILEVENPSPTGIRELQILAMDKERLSRLRNVGLNPDGEFVVHTNERGESFVHDVPGMGQFAYAQISVGSARGGLSAKVVVRSFRGFPVGVVIRAALINRFKSSAYPAGDHRTHLRGWWRRFYEKQRSSL